MRIIYLLQYVPYPPNSGTRIKAYYLLRYLAGQHNVTLVHFYRDAGELLALDGVRELCSSVYSIPLKRSRRSDLVWFIRSLLRSEPFFIIRDSSVQMASVLASLGTANVDLIHVDQLNMAQFIAGNDVPKVLDQHNVVSELFRKMYTQANGLLKLALYIEWRKMLAYERLACLDHDAVVAVSDVDAWQLEALIDGQKQVEVIPIGIDTERFGLLKRDHNPRGVALVGTMDYPPNSHGACWFLNEVWSRILLRVGDTRLKIIGKGLPENLRTLARQSPCVDILGYVDDLEENLKDVGVWIVPLFVGSGVRLKILTALSYGIPVVTTSTGCEGISALSGRELLIADTADAFAEDVIAILQNKELATRLSEQGRVLVVNRYDYRQVYRKWDDIYSQVKAG